MMILGNRKLKYMRQILFKNKKYQCRDSETLLESLQRQGVEMSFSCRKGSCQTCVLKCISGDIPEESQNNLRPALVNNGYFMPCVCVPQGDMVIEDVAHSDLFYPAVVNHKEMLSDNVCRLFLEVQSLTDYRPGQFINLSRPEDGLTRSYSIANRVDDYFIEIHVKRMANGLLSNWILDVLEEGSVVDVQGPNGVSVYPQGIEYKPLLLISSGTGLAPHLGIVRDAIDHHHKGDIFIYHGSQYIDDVYMVDEMKKLSSEYDNINYFCCVKTGPIQNDMYFGDAVKLATLHHSNIDKYRVFLAGSPSMVESAMLDLLNRGVPGEYVYTDPFEYKDLRNCSDGNLDAKLSINNARRSEDKVATCPVYDEVDYPEPDPEMWEALEYGKKLNRILKDFYEIVYQDPRLSPFFENSTKQRSIEKQFTFMRRLFSGEKVYFGDRPRNAHHWMVISNELFDYRESIMVTCLRKHGLPEKLIERWFVLENSFRSDIVKDKPWNKIIDGVEIPVEGYEETVLDIGSLCDSCHQEIDSGTLVRYHIRLGLIYCPACMSVPENNSVAGNNG